MYVTVQQLAKKHSWPSESSLRHLIFHSDINGLNTAIKRVGRRVLIHEPSFFEWVETSNSRKMEAS